MEIVAEFVASTIGSICGGTRTSLSLLEIELSEIEESKKSNALKKIKLAQIKKAQFQLMGMRLVAKDRLREITLWAKIKHELKSCGKFTPDTKQTWPRI